MRIVLRKIYSCERIQSSHLAPENPLKSFTHMTRLSCCRILVANNFISKLFHAQNSPLAQLFRLELASSLKHPVQSENGQKENSFKLFKQFGIQFKTWDYCTTFPTSCSLQKPTVETGEKQLDCKQVLGELAKLISCSIHSPRLFMNPQSYVWIASPPPKFLLLHLASLPNLHCAIASW